MADYSDVCKSLVSAIVPLFFDSPPNPRVLSPSTLVVNGAPLQMRIYRGWPIPTELTADLNARGCHISVDLEQGMSVNTTRFQRTSVVVQTVPITVTAFVSGNTITITGTGTAGQLVGVGYGGTGWTYPCADNDSPEAIAAGLQGLVANSVATGPVLTVATSLPLTASVGATSTSFTPTRQQKQCFRVDVWAPDANTRDLVGATISQALAEVRSFAMPDGTLTGECLQLAQWTQDKAQQAGAWRRWERYQIEYWTATPLVSPPLLHLGLNTGGVLEGEFNPAGPL